MAVAHTFRKLGLLLWKNFILQIRRPVGSCVEIILPVAFLALLILARVNIENKEKCMSNFNDADLDSMSEDVVGYLQKQRKTSSSAHLAYWPLIPEVKRIMDRVALGLNLTVRNQGEFGETFETEEDMIKKVKEEDEFFVGAVVFKNIVANQSLPKVIEYDIRLHHQTPKLLGHSRESWMTKFVYPLFQSPGPSKRDLYSNLYLPIQYQVDSSIIQEQTANDSLFAPKYIQKMPYPNYKEDTFITLIKSFMPIIFVIAYVYTAVMIVKELVAEKQSRLKESMKMMGLANWMHWTAWLIKVLLFFLVIIILQTILLKAGKIFEFSDGSLIFVVLLLYVTSSTFMLFCMSTIFSNAIRAMLFTAGVWFASWAPYASFSTDEKFEALSSGAKFGSCLLPNSCLGIAIQIISRRESTQTGMTWSLVSKAPSIDDSFSLANCFGVFILDIFLYGLLTWYIENVFPGEFGIPKRPWFLFSPSYWCGASEKRGSVHHLQTNIKTGPNFEEEPEGAQLGVAIQDLRKVYKGATGKKVAVESLSLNIYKGQITALLGHNGAGKTTTMSMLTGLFPPTSGTAYINGHSIINDMDKIRESLGLCPQHNVLFDRLTVKEHLEFFTALKGISKIEAAPEINEMIQDINLVDKANSVSSTLSGGMKRKLNCAIALIGGSQTVFLDEPTSGMDPYARRATWDLLQKYRENKTIVLTTHFMDEADYLGDRIAIMADGEVRCCGSSLFLKKRYGVGYHMTIVKGSDFKENQTQNLVAKLVPTSKMVGNIGAEVSYVLHEESTKHFKRLFEELEGKKEQYGISSFGVSVTTLEEVFLKVGEGETLTGVEEFDTRATESMENLHKVDRAESKIEREKLLSGCSLFATQFQAMFIKRLLNSKRQKVAVITQILLPLLLVLCGFLLSISNSNLFDDPPRLLTLAMLKGKDNHLNTFFGDFRSDATLTTRMKSISTNYYTSVEANMIDITDSVLKIENMNSGDNISLLFTQNTFHGSAGGIDPKDCCRYKYLVLNSKCLAMIDSTSKLKGLCGENPKEFGYSHCMECANKDSLFGSSCEDEAPNVQTVDNTKHKLTSKRLYFEEYILEDSGKDLSMYFHNKVGGFMVEPNGDTTVWYVPQSWHGLPSAYSAGSNILLKYNKNDTAYGIKTRNYPLPRNAREKSVAVTENSGTATLVNFMVMATAFISASFVTFLVIEKTSKAKHIQFVSGVSSWCYWSATFCWDMINYMVPAVLIIICFAAFNLEDFNGELGHVFLVLLLFGMSMLPFVYLLSFIFTSHLIAYSVIALLLMVISLALVITVMILNVVDEKDAATVLHYIFLLLPTYAFPQALSDISKNHNLRKTCTQNDYSRITCERSNIVYQDNMLSLKLPGIGCHCLYMFLECIFYFLLTILLEEGFFLSRCLDDKTTNTFSIRVGEDEDVKEERKKVHGGPTEDAAVVVKDLTKVYRTTGMMAVDHLCFEVSKMQCFGLLGVNGAGKTTTFGMLTGELGITDGTAFLDGYNIKTNLKEVQQRIGYCPQFDALIGNLTGREMLRMFARLRGIPSSLLEDIVNVAIDQLNLGKWADKMCGGYSGGNKRKLSTALALVGEPQIVFLDEPTSGMDPASRRFLWNTLSGVLNSGRSIVLTSHSMEECEALCTRLVIMVNGQLKCIGSIQHLKSRFGKGYTLMMKVGADKNGFTNPSYDTGGSTKLSVPANGLKPSSSMQNILENTNQVKEFVQKSFSEAYLVEDRQGYLQYQIMNQDLRWSQIFGVLEENAKRLGVVDYSVSQTSLEQVFINFAKEQHSEDRVFQKSCCSCSCF